MTVKELIERLSLESPDMQVVVDGYEAGFDVVEQIRHVRVTPNLNKIEKHWEGEFNEVYNEAGVPSETALYLPRKS